jgi:exosortase
VRARARPGQHRGSRLLSRAILSAEQANDAVSASAPERVASGRARAARRSDARLSLILAASLLITGAAFRALLRYEAPRVAPPAGVRLEEWFFEPSDSSPLVILVLCGWLLWRRRGRLAACWGQRGSLGVTAGLWLAAAAVLSWAVCARAPELEALALVPTLLGAAHLLGGTAALRAVALPAAVILFAVPIPAPLLNQILWDLQIWTANFTGLLLRGIGMSVLVSGDRIIMREGLFQIIETCSGMRSIETLGLLAILMIDLFERRGPHAWILFLLSPLVAFLINGLRCLGLIFNPHADIASIHSAQGIAMLLGGVLLLYFTDGFLERFPSLRGETRPTRRAPRGAASRLGRRGAIALAFSAALFAISWFPAFPRAAVALNSPAGEIQASLDGWAGTDEKIDWMFYGTAGFGQVVDRRYARGGEQVEVFIGQAPGDGRPRSYLTDKAGFPGSGWITEREQPDRIAGREATLRVLRKGATRVLAVSWFEASPGLVVESARALVGLDATALLPRRKIPLAVRLATPLASAADPASESTRQLLERFAEQISPALLRLSTPRES